MSKSKDRPATGVRGFLLSDVFGRESQFFRVYHYGETDENGHTKFTDYEILAEDVEVEILSDDVILNDDEEILDWNTKVLGENIKENIK